MYPALRDGDVVTIDTAAYAERLPVVGEIVLARHPFRADVEIVKRVGSVTADGRIVLVGDDPRESEDSHSFGPVRADLLIGRLIES